MVKNEQSSVGGKKSQFEWVWLHCIEVLILTFKKLPLMQNCSGC